MFCVISMLQTLQVNSWISINKATSTLFLLFLLFLLLHKLFYIFTPFPFFRLIILTSRTWFYRLFSFKLLLIQYLFSYFLKQCIYIRCQSCRSLPKRSPQLIRWITKIYTKIDGLFMSNLPLLLEIILIPHHKLDSLLINILLNLSNPTLHIIKRCSISNIIDYYYPISPSIITTGNRLKSILTSSIPLFL